jgi:hypothetical protein
MDIRPANLAQLHRAKDGRMVMIDDDVLNIARDLNQIDENLKLRYSEEGEYFVVYQILPTGDQQLVLTSQDLNPQIVERIRQIGHSSYDYAKELEKQDAQAERDRLHANRERDGEVSERLAHAVRRDLGDQSRVYFKGK